MNWKLMRLAPILVVALALGATSAAPTTAEVGGHFTFEVEAVTLKGLDVPGPLGNHYYNPEVKTRVACTTVTYAGSVTSAMKTATELKLTPTHIGCFDTGTKEAATYTMNGCEYVLTVRKVEPEKKDNTFLLKCPAGAKMEIAVKEGGLTCTIKVKEQKPPTGGISYITEGTGKTHDIRAEVTMSGIEAEYYGGLGACGYFNNPETVKNDQMTGQFTLRGYNIDDEQIGITATGN